MRARAFGLPPAGPVVVSLVLATVAGAFLWVVGVSLVFSIAVGLLIVAAGIAWAGFSDSSAPETHRRRPTARPGTRSDVAQLSWALRTRTGNVSDPGWRRVRISARNRLARIGLDVDDPADRAVLADALGDEGLSVLGSHGDPPSLAAVDRCTAAVERLVERGRTGA